MSGREGMIAITAIADYGQPLQVELQGGSGRIRGYLQASDASGIALSHASRYGAKGERLSASQEIFLPWGSVAYALRIEGETL